VLVLDEIEECLTSERILSQEKGLKEQLIGIKEELLGMDGIICVPSFSKGNLIGFLILGEKLSGDIYTQEDVRLLATLASEVAIAVENAKNFEEVEKLREKERESYVQTVLALAQTVDEKDSYTHGHLEDVSYYGMQVAEELQVSSEFKGTINKEDLETALRLHDIGKIGVPDVILNKNGKLSPHEWAIMKQHCEIGARIVEPIAKLKNVGNIIKHHQEKYDGTGYPDGLKGEEIPLESRIISVVDSYHAMVSDRPYRKALPEQVALQELKNNIGTQFDPIVVAAFVRAWEKGKMKKA
jgi:HD-GYP domain-containing protein (c-di-GMP phosphodiesterase class II)